jgi:hypothetical protein
MRKKGCPVNSIVASLTQTFRTRGWIRFFLLRGDERIGWMVRTFFRARATSRVGHWQYVFQGDAWWYRGGNMSINLGGAEIASLRLREDVGELRFTGDRTLHWRRLDWRRWELVSEDEAVRVVLRHRIYVVWHSFELEVEPGWLDADEVVVLALFLTFVRIVASEKTFHRSTRGLD